MGRKREVERKTRRRPGCLSGWAIAGCCAPLALAADAAQAQSAADAESADGAVIEEMVVTATRRETALRDVPASVQAFGETQLELPAFNDVRDVFNLVPGATIQSNKPPVAEGIQLRGSGITQSNADDGLPPVGYYIDDVPYVDVSTPVPPPIGTFDLQRIEVIRGPQGTSYGQDSAGGNVRLVTNPVDLTGFGYKLRGGLASVRSAGTGYQAGVVFNAPIVEDTLGVRVGYYREDDPGYGEVTGLDIDRPLEFTRDTLRAKVRWRPTERVDITATHSRWVSHYAVLPGSQIEDTTGGRMIVRPLVTELALAAYPSGIPTNDYEIGWTTLTGKFDLDFAELTSSTGFVDAPTKEVNGEFLEFGFPIGVLANQPAETFSQELRLVSAHEGRLQWLGGLFYLDAMSENLSQVQLDLSVFGLASSEQLIRDPIDTQRTAVYGEIDYAINEQWNVQAGVRYQEQDRTNGNFVTNRREADPTLPDDPLLGPYSLAEDPNIEDFSFDNLSYRVGATWKPADNGFFYISYATAARAPIVLTASDALILERAGVASLVSRDASELLNTEIGTKWTLLDGALYVEAAYARGAWQEVPLRAGVMVPGEMPATLSLGGTDAVVGAFELSVVWRPLDNLTLSYGGSLIDTEVTDVPGPDEVEGFPAAIRDGGELFNYAPWTHSFSGNVTFPLGASSWTGFAGAAYTLRDKPDGFDAVFDRFEPAYVPARDQYESLSLNVGAQTGPWTIGLSVANATDFDGMYEPGTADDMDGIIPAPRSFILQVSYDGMDN